MENVRKHRDITLETTKARGNYVESEPNYHTIFFFLSGNSLAKEMKRTDTHEATCIFRSINIRNK